MKNSMPEELKVFFAKLNSYNIDEILNFFHEDAVIEELSIGRTLATPDEIKAYFIDYFVSYKTKTKLKTYKFEDGLHKVNVSFTGNFSSHGADGYLNFKIFDHKIIKITADLYR